MARKREPAEIEVSFESIELCLLNATRLLQDSTKVSLPTAAALAELSVEEACKAWMLFLVWSLDRKPKPRERQLKFTTKQSALLLDLFKKNHRYIEMLSANLRPALRDHPPKLKFLKFLFDLLHAIGPLADAQQEYVAQMFESMLGRSFDARRLLKLGEGQPKRDVFENFRRGGLEDLDKIKNRGLYVDVAPLGELVVPDLNLPTAQLVQELAGSLIGYLKVTLLGLAQ